jgi:hypothetical protein
MQRKHGKAILLTLGLGVSVSMAHAAEKTLEFQLVSKALDPQILEAPNIENQTIMQSKGFGVAVFKDGRVGTKDYTLTRDANKGVGTLVGYSTYYFDEGSVTARFTATVGGPQGTHGDYKILGGVGDYAGAKADISGADRDSHAAVGGAFRRGPAVDRVHRRANGIQLRLVA